MAATGTVGAHEGGPRILVSPDRVGPGGVVEVRGEDLGPDAAVSLALVGATGQVELGPAMADGEGHINAALALPPELAVGTYRLRATVRGGNGPLDAILIVEGPAVAAGGAPGEKDEDDLLLIPLPAGWQRSLSGPIVTAIPVTETLPAGSASRGSIDAIVAVVVLALAGGSIGLVIASRIRSRI